MWYGLQSIFQAYRDIEDIYLFTYPFNHTKKQYISAIKTLFKDYDEFHGSLSIDICWVFLYQFTILL